MFNPDYRDILSAFFDEKVEYLVVGAYALAAHGNPRATGDIDLWVRPTPTNAARVIMALMKFGASIDRVKESDFSEPNLVFQIGIAPRRIDILTSITGVTNFSEAWRGRLDLQVEGIHVPVLGRQHLIQNKRATGRLQDLADVAWLEGNA